MEDLDISAQAPEEGNDEVENALGKARFYSRLSGMPALADDSGMYIDALGGEPGVMVRRWAGRFPDEVSDEDWLDYLMGRMKDVPEERRTGRFKVARAIVAPRGGEYVLECEREFKVALEPDRENHEKGWPMSKVYIEKGSNKPWSKMDWEERTDYERENLTKFKEIFDKI